MNLNDPENNYKNVFWKNFSTRVYILQDLEAINSIKNTLFVFFEQSYTIRLRIYN